MYFPCQYTSGVYISLFYFFQNTTKIAHLLSQAVYTPNQSGVKVSEFFSGKSRLTTLFNRPGVAGAVL